MLQEASWPALCLKMFAVGAPELARQVAGKQLLLSLEVEDLAMVYSEGGIMMTMRCLGYWNYTVAVTWICFLEGVSSPAKTRRLSITRSTLTTSLVG